MRERDLLRRPLPTHPYGRGRLNATLYDLLRPGRQRPLSEQIGRRINLRPR
jgi:hypothetical protein